MPASRTRPAVLLAILAMAAAPAGATTVALTVDEPSGVARINDPVTSGVPIAIDDTLNASWALLDGSKEIPVQTRVLFGIRNPWLLVDFMASVEAGGSRTYTLVSRPPTVTASPALSIDDTAPSSITVTTGPLKVVIGKNPYNLFDGVWLDRDHNGTFSSSTERLVNSTSSDNLPLVLAGDLARRGRRAPVRWSWEDRGPLRATLRVDGFYADPSAPTDTVLHYTDRITFHAGQAYVTVDHVIRNSFATSERYVKVKSASLLVPGTNPGKGHMRRSGDRGWLQPGKKGVAFEMIPDTVEFTADYRGGARIQGKLRTSANGGMIVPDWGYHGACARFDFSDTTLSKGEGERRQTRYIDRLDARASASWYSERGAFGSEHFGTWENEKTANQQWSWQWENTTPSPIPGVRFNCYSREHAMPRPDWDYYPSWATLSAALSLEEDDLWANLLMYARVGQRTYLDRAQRWSRYFTWEYAYRTDGFAYRDGLGCDPLVRARKDLPTGVTLTTADRRFIDLNTKNEESRGRDERNHSWNGGLVDYYYLTGDRDALAAALDIAEYSKRYIECEDIDSLEGGAAVRFYARAYLNLLRAWEATGSPYWRLSANRVKAMFFHSQRYDPRGFYYSLKHTRYPGGKYVAPFQAGIVSQALYRDWVLTADGSHNDSLAVRLRALADFAYKYGADPVTGFTGDNIVVDYPSPGNVLHLSYSTFPDSLPPTDPTPMSSASFVDALTIGRRLGGPSCYMSKARSLWEHASKYIRWSDAKVYRIADDAHLGRFVHTFQCGDGIGPVDDALTTMQFYFHDEALAAFDYVAPNRVGTLAVSPSYAKAVVRWRAPGDDGATGRASAYDLRFSTAPITPANFGAARPVSTGPPDAAGIPQCAEVRGLTPCRTYWFALRTRDECNTWSALSSVAAVTIDCIRGQNYDDCGETPISSASRAEEEPADVPRAVEFALVGPNPVVGPSTVAFGVPASMAGQRLEIGIFDVAGRRVQSLYAGEAHAGRFRVAWNEGAALPAGAYFLAMRLGGESRARKFILVR